MFLDVFSYHRDPEYFADPLEFNPNRWDDSKSHSQLLTFGMGVRSCFGKRLANTELKTLLFTLLQKYTIEPVENKPLEAEFVFGKEIS